MQSINIGLALLCCEVPVLFNDIRILALEKCFGAAEIQCPIIERVTRHIQQYPSVFKAATMAKVACSSMVVGLPNDEGRSPKVTLGRKHGMESNNTYMYMYTCPIIAVLDFDFRRL